MRRLLFVILCLVFYSEAFAVDPRLHWQTLETEHFSIHFAEGYQALAEKAAGIAERSHAKLSVKLNWQPADKTHLVLSDQTDMPNGYAIPFPFSRSVLFVVPPDELGSLEDFDDWLELLIGHEYVHILHLDKSSGAVSNLRKVFGRNVLLFPNMYQPAWFIEGLATYLETDNERHIGRGQSSLFQMMMRSEVSAGIKPVSQANLSLRSWPLGTTYYLYGVHFFQFIEDRYGVEAIDLLIENYSNNIIPFMINTNASQVLEKDITELWTEFEDWLAQHYEPQISSIEQQGIRQGQAITDSGYFTGPVKTAPDGQVYYVNSGAFEHAALYTIDNQGEHKRLVDVHTRVRLDVNDNQEVLIAQVEYCDFYNINYDLFLLKPGQDQLKQITECGRYRSASWSADGEQIVAVRSSHSLSELHLLDARGQQQAVLWQGQYGEIVGEPDWSPDNRYVVASVFRPGKGWNIERFDMQLREWQSITDDDFIDANPQYDATGSAIVFSSERDGVYNVFRFDFASAELQRLTNVASGAFRPSQLNADSPLYYVGYGANGYDVFRMDDVTTLQSDSYQPQQRPEQPTVAEQPAPVHEISDYSPWSSLAPRWWFPIVVVDNDKAEYGVTTSGTDALGIHTYVLNAAYDAENDWFTGSVGYRYAQRFSLGLSRSSDILLDQNGNFAVARKEDDAYLSYMFPWLKVDRSWTLVLAILASHEFDARRAPGIPALPDQYDNVLGIAGLFNNAKNYIRSISANDGRDVRLVAESSDVMHSDYTGEVYTLDWREYLHIGGQHVLALRFTEGYGTDMPDDFELGGEETDFQMVDVIVPSHKPVIGRREFPLRGYPTGLPQLTGRRMQLASMEYRFPIALVERGLMAPPVGIIQWAGSAFVDSGAVWQDGGSPDDYFTGVGLELHADVSLFYGLNLKMRLGVASGLDEQLGEDRAYFSLGAAF